MKPEWQTTETYERMWRAFSRNPRTKLLDTPFRIYGKSDASIWAAVDEDDYRYFSQWLWSYSMSPGGKIYVKRNSGSGTIQKRIDGKRVTVAYRRGSGRTLYLHREIMIRSGVLPPTPEHKIVDHEDGNSLNAQKINLRWATIGMNNRNKFGLTALERLENPELYSTVEL
jgi:hypothetical protein